jgi:hypothetical protein
MITSRLNTLIDYLKTVPEERYVPLTWSCGSKACVLGHATRIQEFKQLGLYYDPYEACIVFEGKSYGHRLFNESAGAVFFGIPIDHARLLFYTTDSGLCDDFYGGRVLSSVIKRLEEYVSTKGQNVEKFLYVPCTVESMP